MKRYEFDLKNHAIELFFPTILVKSKIQILNILMEATRYMLYTPRINQKNVKSKIILLVDKMSRLFFINNDKYYSIVFPFLVNDYSDEIHFSFQNEIEVDSFLISNVISIIKCDSFKVKCSLEFIDPIYSYENEYNVNFWVFLRELLLMEDGYIRYDKDKEGFQKAKEKGEEHKHPLNHYDLFYSSNASFKLGIYNDIIDDEFIDLLNIKTDCKYINNY